MISLLAALTATAAASTTRPDEPAGDWLVAKRVAIIRIVNCGGRIWGVVAWEKVPALDKNNSDPAKRSRPTLGMPVLLGMEQSKSHEWSGEIYNSQDGRTYDANISLSNGNTLRVEGCALGLLCGSEDWSRVSQSTTGAPGGPKRDGATLAESSQVTCARLTTSGSSH